MNKSKWTYSERSIIKQYKKRGYNFKLVKNIVMKEFGYDILISQ